MINALIRNKDETAIVECPLDSFKMILQLRSIGIYENPRNIKLTDNEKDDIHIRLYDQTPQEFCSSVCGEENLIIGGLQ